MRIALLFGSSGLVGGHLLNQLIKDNNYSKIKLFVRTAPEVSVPKLPTPHHLYLFQIFSVRIFL